MPTLQFTISYGENGGLVMSPSELIENYFLGIPTCTKDGKELTQETITMKILEAQQMVQNILQVKLFRQVVEESRDFIRDEYFNWGYFRVTYPVSDVVSLFGFISTTKQTEFPYEWVSRSVNNNEDLLFRSLAIVPAGSLTPNVNSVVFVGITPNAGFMGVHNIPNYWRIKYVSGFTKVPADIRGLIGKLAAIQLFAILGDFIMGVGVASKSLSFDGLSQNLSSTQSAGNSLFGARIKQYVEEMGRDIPVMKDHYVGINFTAL